MNCRMICSVLAHPLTGSRLPGGADGIKRPAGPSGTGVPARENRKIFSRASPENVLKSSQGRCPVKDTGPELVLLGRGGGI
ncbi:hypothetical protein GCM10010495_14690 [Kitasatospora herbaricolor]|nr:hypothetical protein GCM10010495_14690 [Kitasatospora herbaricolor]